MTSSWTPIEFAVWPRWKCGLLLLLLLHNTSGVKCSPTSPDCIDTVEHILRHVQMLLIRALPETSGLHADSSQHDEPPQQQQQQEERNDDFPFVTVSYAQTLDGKVAAHCRSRPDLALQQTPYTTTTSSNYPISGHESLLLTHGLRSIHDGILIGGRTLSIDRPRLTNRLYIIQNKEQQQPRPIVLDTHLQHIRHVGIACQLQNPILCCSEHAATQFLKNQDEFPIQVELLPCKLTSDGNIDLIDALVQLKTKCSISSIMVEGGNSVLTWFLSHGCFDCLCITIAPKFMGPGVGPNPPNALDFVSLNPQYFTLGNDVIVVCTR